MGVVCTVGGRSPIGGGRCGGGGSGRCDRFERRKYSRFALALDFVETFHDQLGDGLLHGREVVANFLLQTFTDGFGGDGVEVGGGEDGIDDGGIGGTLLGGYCRNGQSVKLGGGTCV